MGRIMCGTRIVFEDEPCLGLREENLRAPDSRGFHRYQTLTVKRDDKPAEMTIDMGLAEDFSSEPFAIPGGAMENGRYYVEHTVGELRDIADHLRQTRLFDKWDLAEMEQGKQLKIPDYRRIER